MRKRRVVVLVLGSVAVVAAAMIGLGIWNKRKQDEKERALEEAALKRLRSGPFDYDVTATDLVADFKNQVTGNARYGHAVLRVSGRLKEVSQLKDGIVVYAFGDGHSTTVEAQLNVIACVYVGDASLLTRFEPPHQLVMHSLGAGFADGSPVLKYCVIEPP